MSSRMARAKASASTEKPLCSASDSWAIRPDSWLEMAVPIWVPTVPDAAAIWAASCRESCVAMVSAACPTSAPSVDER